MADALPRASAQWRVSAERGKLPAVLARAMVLCAGLGTRLRPLTDELPKPLVPIGDRSILAHISAALGSAGVRRVVLNTHHLQDKFPSVIESLEIEAQVVHEPEIRGTAGGVAGARAWLTPPVLVWNGDIFIRPALAELLAWQGDFLALLVAPRPAGEGTVGLADDGRVVRLRGERFGDETRGGDYVGIALLGARCLAALPERGCLIGDVALPELRRGGKVETLLHEGAWSDAGDLASYLEANLRFVDEQTWGDALVAVDAEVDPGVTIARSVIGSGARVSGSGKLERVVVWPGARVTAPLEGAVVTSSGRVVRL